MIEAKHHGLSVKRQCELLELPRSTYYHRPEPESDENLALIRVIDETYLAFPFFGSRQMTRWLRRQGHRVNRKRVRRLMAEMGWRRFIAGRTCRKRRRRIGFTRICCGN